jgi:hypothetical protein
MGIEQIPETSYADYIVKIWVTIDGILTWWLDLFDSSLQRMTTIYSSLLHAHWCPQSRRHRRCLVAASNGGRSGVNVPGERSSVGL